MRGIILFGHGSRDAQWRKPMDAIATRVARREPEALVSCAFLEFAEPDLLAAAAQLLERGADALHVVPIFIGVGKHAREDLPRLIDRLVSMYPSIPVTLAPAIGERADVLDLLSAVALQTGGEAMK